MVVPADVDPNTSRSPLRLLVSACDWPPGEARNAALLALVADFADWEGLVRLTKRHRVAGLVHEALRAAGVTVPTVTAAALAEAAGRVTLRGMACTAETVRLQRLLDEAGIPIVFFKGVTLSARAYGAITLKDGKDVDCLVPVEQVRQCVALLERHGYRLFKPRDTLSDRQWEALLRFDKELSLFSDATGVEVEVHWRLTSVAGLLPTAPLAGATVRHETLGQQRIATFAPDDLFAYLCAHGAESGWSRLKWLADLNALTSRSQVGELARLHRHAAARGAGPSATLALALCSVWFGRELPETISVELQTSWRLRAMRAIAIRNLVDPEAALPWHRNLAMYLLLASTHGGLRRELLRSVIAIDDAMQVPLPAALYFLYPIMRLRFAFGRKRLVRHPGKKGRAFETPPTS